MGRKPNNERLGLPAYYDDHGKPGHGAYIVAQLVGYFTDKVRSYERERCAKIAEAMGAHDVAEAIRKPHEIHAKV
jgi:hypothetical protein